VTTLFLRFALGASFLSAVADRLGLWGPPGTPGVAWGAWGPFVAYAGVLNAWAPDALVEPIAWIATGAEIVFGVGLIVGWKVRWMALGSGALLTSFALSMAVYDGIKAPLDFSVFSAAAGAFLLASVARE